jgi:ribonuclease D
LQAKADELKLPVENLLTPDYLRRVAWRPPAEVSQETIAAELRSLGAREWQISFAAPILTEACLHPKPLPAKESKAKDAQLSKDVG